MAAETLDAHEEVGRPRHHPHRRRLVDQGHALVRAGHPRRAARRLHGERLEEGRDAAKIPGMDGDPQGRQRDGEAPRCARHEGGGERQGRRGCRGGAEGVEDGREGHDAGQGTGPPTKGSTTKGSPSTKARSKKPAKSAGARRERAWVRAQARVRRRRCGPRTSSRSVVSSAKAPKAASLPVERGSSFCPRRPPHRDVREEEAQDGPRRVAEARRASSPRAATAPPRWRTARSSARARAPGPPRRPTPPGRRVHRADEVPAKLDGARYGDPQVQVPAPTSPRTTGVVGDVHQQVRRDAHRLTAGLGQHVLVADHRRPPHCARHERYLALARRHPEAAREDASQPGDAIAEGTVSPNQRRWRLS